jgi:hypothetical protein
MIYTPKIKSEVRSIKAPHDFIIDIVEYDLDPKNPFLGIRFYESQWNYYTDLERLHCIAYLEKIRKILTGYGLNVTLEPTIDTGETLPEEFRKRRYMI